MMNRITNINFHTEVTGKDKGSPPLLLLHGFTGSSKAWDPFIPLLSKQHQIITPDLIGHGQSDAPDDPERYSLDHAANDMIDVLDKLAIKKVNLLGYSMGGRLALMIACKYPERISSLILESSSPGLKSEDERKERMTSDDKLAAFIEQEGIEAFVDHWENIPLFQTQKRVLLEERNKLRVNRLAQTENGLANSLRGMGTGRQPSLWEYLPRLSFPVLLLAGEYDKKYVAIAKEMAKLLPLSQLTIAPRTGHAIHFEKKEFFSNIVSRFLHNPHEKLGGTN